MAEKTSTPIGSESSTSGMEKESSRPQSEQTAAKDAIDKSPSPDVDKEDSTNQAAKEQKLVPVNEAIRYRRRAQQAEAMLKETEQQLKDAQAQLAERMEQLATAEAQRDELQHQLNSLQVRLQAEKMFRSAGVSDIETAMALLEKRIKLEDETDDAKLRGAIEQLIQDKPILVSTPPNLPGKTASARIDGAGMASRLAASANKAMMTGNRRDLAEYLRLRRLKNASF